MGQRFHIKAFRQHDEMQPSQNSHQIGQAMQYTPEASQAPDREIIGRDRQGDHRDKACEPYGHIGAFDNLSPDLVEALQIKYEPDQEMRRDIGKSHHADGSAESHQIDPSKMQQRLNGETQN